MSAVAVAYRAHSALPDAQSSSVDYAGFRVLCCVCFRPIYRLPLAADTAPYNSARVMRHETCADAAMHRTARAKPSPSGGAAAAENSAALRSAHAACAHVPRNQRLQRRGALSA